MKQNSGVAEAWEVPRSWFLHFLAVRVQIGQVFLLALYSKAEVVVVHLFSSVRLQVSKTRLMRCFLHVDGAYLDIRILDHPPLLSVLQWILLRMVSQHLTTDIGEHIEILQYGRLQAVNVYRRY